MDGYQWTMLPQYKGRHHEKAMVKITSSRFCLKSDIIFWFRKNYFKRRRNYDVTFY